LHSGHRSVHGTAPDLSGSANCTIPAGEARWSDITALPIDPAKSYLVTYLIANGAGRATPWIWRRLRAGHSINSFVCLGTNAPATVSGTFASPVWSTNSAVLPIEPIVAVGTLFVSHPEEGTYTTRILDTTVDRPIYNTLEWAEEEPSGTQVGLRVRTDDDPGMANATAWSNLTPITVSGTMISVPVKRYAQFQLILNSSSLGQDTPRVRDVTLAWTGEERVVDVGGTFTKGPQYGQFELTVDGQKLQTGIVVDLELYRDVRGFYSTGTRRITSSATMEMMPRNTGL